MAELMSVGHLEPDSPATPMAPLPEGLATATKAYRYQLEVIPVPLPFVFQIPHD